MILTSCSCSTPRRTTFWMRIVHQRVNRELCCFAKRVVSDWLQVAFDFRCHFGVYLTNISINSNGEAKVNLDLDSLSARDDLRSLVITRKQSYFSSTIFIKEISSVSVCKRHNRVPKQNDENNNSRRVRSKHKPNENQDFVEEKFQFELKLYRLTKSMALNSNF